MRNPIYEVKRHTSCCGTMLEVRRDGKMVMVLKETHSFGCKFSGVFTLKKYFLRSPLPYCEEQTNTVGSTHTLRLWLTLNP